MKCLFSVDLLVYSLQIRLTNVPIIGGVAFLRCENVVEIGGNVFEIQTQHRSRLFEELGRRMDEEEEDAAVRLLQN